MKILDIGCGINKITDAIGIDSNPNSAADIIYDLNEFPYPFSENTFDKIYCIDVLEHLNDIIKVMEEIHRISNPGAEIFIRVPHFSSTHSYGDPTHKHYFNTQSFDYFTGGFNQYGAYTDCKFKKISTKLIFWRLHRINGISFLANRFLLLYEKLFAFIFTAMNIEFRLSVIK
jgi:SAM-dependent methyltransferase